MTITVARLSLFALVAFATGSLRADVLIAFRPKAVVESGVVTLGDIADVRSADPAERQKLSGIILGPAPAANRTTTLDFETVRSRLSSAGVSLLETQFSGPSTVTLSGVAASTDAVEDRPAHPARSTTSTSESQLAIEAAIRRYLAACSDGQSYAVAAKLESQSAATVAGSEARGFEVSGGTPPWTGSQTFTLRFIDPTETIQQVHVRCEVALRPSILAAKRSLPRGHVIRADDLVWKKAESDSEAGCATDPNAVLGMETQQPIRTGQGVSHAALKALPLVRNGQFVTVTSRRPGMSVQRVMKAKSDGTAGEVIALLTLEDRKTIMAKVTGLQEAEVVDGPTSDSWAALPGPPGLIAGGPILQTAYKVDDAQPQTRSAPNDSRVHVNPAHMLSVPETN